MPNVGRLAGESAMLIITGSMRVDPDDLPQFLADFDLLAAETRLRKGSISYDAALADAKAGLFLISERWADQASLDAHLAAADTVAFIDRWSGRMQGDLKKYDASNERYLME
jgi:quinol monooxygenase YgiN